MTYGFRSIKGKQQLDLKNNELMIIILSPTLFPIPNMTRLKIYCTNTSNMAICIIITSDFSEQFKISQIINWYKKTRYEK